MPTIDNIHRENLKLLAQEHGGVAAVAAKIGCSSSQYSQWLNGSENSGTGKPRGMRPSSARKIEERVGKPVGWLDAPHATEAFEELGRLPDESANVVPDGGRVQSQVASIISMEAGSAGEMRLLTMYRLTDDDGRRALDALVETLARRVDATREGKHAA